MEISKQINHSNPLDGINFYSFKTGVRKFVSFKGSIFGGKVFYNKNKLIPEILVEMLDKGTTKRNKFEIANILENVGGKINFTPGKYRVFISGQCLTKDISLILELISEQLIEPLINEQDLESVKKINIAELNHLKDDTRTRGMEKFLSCLYPENHPNRPFGIEKEINEIKNINSGELLKFHKENYGLGNLDFCFVGDLDHNNVDKEISKLFKSWQTSPLNKNLVNSNLNAKVYSNKSDIVFIPDKTSADLIIGHGIGIDNNHEDYYNITMGHFILGGNFSARLMSTIREKEGLTYGIQSSISGADNDNDGYWNIWGTFSPSDIEKAKKLILEQLELWSQKGVSKQELEVKKTTINGMYKVSFDRTTGIISRIMDTIYNNKPLSFIDEYPSIINNLQLNDINEAIKKYYTKEKCITIVSGSVK